MITCLWCKLDCVADLRAENYLLCPSESCLLPLFVLLFVLVQVHSGSEFSTEGLSGEKSLFFFSPSFQLHRIVSLLSLSSFEKHQAAYVAGQQGFFTLCGMKGESGLVGEIIIHHCLN